MSYLNQIIANLKTTSIESGFENPFRVFLELSRPFLMNLDLIKPSNRLRKLRLKDGNFYYRDNPHDIKQLNQLENSEYRFSDIKTPIKSYVDIGSGTGVSIRAFMRAHPECSPKKIVGFEALPSNVTLAKLNTKSLVNLACLYSEKRSIFLFVDEFGVMASSQKYDYKQNMEVMYTKRLEDFDLHKAIDLMKIDVEGMEIEVLKGFPRFEKVVKVLIVEISNENLKEYGLMTKGFDHERIGQGNGFSLIRSINRNLCKTKNIFD